MEEREGEEKLCEKNSSSYQFHVAFFHWPTLYTKGSVRKSHHFSSLSNSSFTNSPLNKLNRCTVYTLDTLRSSRRMGEEGGNEYGGEVILVPLEYGA